MELYPINNAIEAKKIFEQMSYEVRSFEKVGSSGNKYRIAVNRDGIAQNDIDRINDIFARVLTSYGYDSMDVLVFIIELYGVE